MTRKMASNQVITQEVLNRTEYFFRVPFENQQILPTLLPLIAGAVIMELYFGKHKQEALGWNTSVGNAALWMTTGVSLLISESSLTQPELYAVYGLIGLGAVVTFLDFFHIWSSTVAFVVSSSAMVYTLAYTLVVTIKSGFPADQVTLKAAVLFFVSVNLIFKIIQGFETDEDSSMDFS
ncbi:hypothetical protein GLT90_00130 [Nanohaloarchaea archaeon H12]|nr:hypothetical protein [Nanohaloarchaea archaeon H12]